MAEINKHVILVSPLDWGLGHASRCIPIIKFLNESGYKVICASDGKAGRLLKEEFPEILHITLKGYHIRYSEGKTITGIITKQLPKIIFSIIREHFTIKKIVKKYNVHTVISDNRYGLYHKKIQTVFITHQINIKTPLGGFFSRFVNKINHYFIDKFNYCWVPDNENQDNLSGELSHSKIDDPLSYINKKITNGTLSYIGTLTRFSSVNFEQENKIVGIVSGPEPQRTIFEKKLITLFSEYNGKTNIICGNPEDTEIIRTNNLTIYPHLKTEDLERLLASASVVICRSGYSTVMDLAVLNKKVIVVPTPGQTEQEYLATYLSEKKMVYNASEKQLNLDDILLVIQEIKPLYCPSSHCFEKEIKKILE